MATKLDKQNVNAVAKAEEKPPKYNKNFYNTSAEDVFTDTLKGTESFRIQIPNYLPNMEEFEKGQSNRALTSAAGFLTALANPSKANESLARVSQAQAEETQYIRDIEYAANYQARTVDAPHFRREAATPEDKDAQKRIDAARKLDEEGRDAATKLFNRVSTIIPASYDPSLQVSSLKDVIKSDQAGVRPSLEAAYRNAFKNFTPEGFSKVYSGVSTALRGGDYGAVGLNPYGAKSLASLDVTPATLASNPTAYKALVTNIANMMTYYARANNIKPNQ